MNHMIDSDFIKSLILMSGVLASLLFLPLSGKWIDKMDKRKILIYSSMLRCLSPVCMFPALAFDSIPWMMASLILNQVTSAVYFPTVRTSLPVLVDKTELLQANTIYMNIVTISRITGTAVGGIMVASLSLNDLYLGSLGGFLILTIITSFVRIPSREGQQTGRNKEKIRFSEVFTILPKQPAVLMGIIMSSTINLFLGGFNLLVLAFSRAQDSPDVMGWIYTVEGASILIAGLFVRRFTAGFNLMIMSAFLLFGFAVSQFGMSFADSRLSVLLSFAIFGCMVSFFFPTITTVFQKKLHEGIQGRFFSFKEMADRLVVQIALLATGACLDLIGISAYMLLLAALTGGIAILSIFWIKRLKLDVRQFDDGITYKETAKNTSQKRL